MRNAADTTLRRVRIPRSAPWRLAAVRRLSPVQSAVRDAEQELRREQDCVVRTVRLARTEQLDQDFGQRMVETNCTEQTSKVGVVATPLLARMILDRPPDRNCSLQAGAARAELSRMMPM